MLTLALATQTAAADAPAPAAAKPQAAAAKTPSTFISRGDKLLFDGRHTHKAYKRAVVQYQSALKLGVLDDKAQAELHAKIAEAYFNRGEITEQESAKIKLYEQGQKEAEKGLKLNNDCVPCIFWRVSNLGRAGEQRGIMRSLFMLPEVKREYARCLKLDPDYADCILAQAMIDVMVPGIAGGDTDRARKSFKRLLNKAPNHTRAMVDYAVLLEDEGEEKKAIALLKKVIAHKNPYAPGAWRKIDKPRAQRLLKEWD
jgi:tetratricopeptide (TPR) repeat protein